MDLDRFETREKAHEGVNIPLVVDGETQYGDDDQPITFKMKGLVDPEVHRLILQSGRTGGARTPEEVLASDLKLARASCLGWSDNWTLKGRKIAFSRSAVDEVFSVPVIRVAILGEVHKNAHFMNGRSGEPSSTSDS